jgi:hypothetical protein
MKIFTCEACGQKLFFDNIACERCGRRLGVLPDTLSMLALDPDGDRWRPVNSQSNGLRFCANAEFGVCNWLVAADSDAAYCAACQHNRTIPDIGDPTKLAQWRKLEFGKHHLFYSLIRFGLPLSGEPALLFDFLADGDTGQGKVMTGHDSGLITIALAEADDAVRETRRTSMREPYRTIIGHFRHEIGHYYWERLVAGSPALARFRAIFGDERADYRQALSSYYESGPRGDWRDNSVSAYATMHPWEDFAETWAHYFHIVDALETAASVNLRVAALDDRQDANLSVPFDPYRAPSVERLVSLWIPFSIALNAINRSVGQPDLYPFVLSPGVLPKMAFIHEIIQPSSPR